MNNTLPSSYSSIDEIEDNVNDDEDEIIDEQTNLLQQKNKQRCCSVM